MKIVDRHELQQTGDTLPNEQPCPEKAPKKPIPRKLLFIVAAAVLAAVLLCLFLPNLLANLRADKWQERAEKAYEQAAFSWVYHITAEKTNQEKGKAPEVVRKSEHWRYHNKRLSIDDHGEGNISYSVIQDYAEYTRKVTPEDPDALWKGPWAVMEELRYCPETLSEAEFVLSKIRATVAGTEVTYTNAEREGESMTFHFNLFGKFFGLTHVKEDPEQQTKAMIYYAFHNTSEEKILETITQYYQEAESTAK